MAGEINRIETSITVNPQLADSSNYKEQLETETSKAIKEGVEEGFSKLPQSSFAVLNNKLNLLQSKIKGLIAGDDIKDIKAEERILNTQEKLLATQKKIAEINRGAELSEAFGGLFTQNELSKQNIYSEKQKLIQDKLEQGNLTVADTLRLYEQLLNLKQKEANIEKKSKAEGEKRQQAEQKAQEKLLATQKKTDEKDESTSSLFDKFAKRFGSVATYRVIRTIIKEISDAVRESITALTQLSPELNKSISGLTSSVEKLKATSGVSIYGIFTILEPIIGIVTELLGNFGNTLSGVTAVIRGQNEYLKVNLDYWKDYQDTLKGTLLSFDTFTTLSDQTSFGVFEIKEVTDETKAGLLLTIAASLASAGAAIAVNWDKVLSVFSKIKTKLTDLVSPTSTVANNLNQTTNAIKGVNTQTSSFLTKLSSGLSIGMGLFETFYGISNIMNWDEQTSDVKKWTDSLTVAAGVLSVVAGFLMLSTNPTLAGIAKVVAGVAAVAGVASMVVSSLNTKTYANGGMFEGAGTMYALAGENGAEVVAKGASGTGVTNVEQFADAMYLALVRYGAAKGEDMTVNIGADNVSSLGTAIARSDGFIREVNRKNPTIRLK